MSQRLARSRDQAAQEKPERPPHPGAAEGRVVSPDPLRMVPAESSFTTLVPWHF